MVGAGVIKTHIKNQKCNVTDADLWLTTKTWLMITRTQFYNVTGFSWVYFIIFEYFYLSTRFVWLLCPTFVISFALNLSMKFQQIKERLKNTNSIQMNRTFWHEIHRDYLIVCNLTLKASEFLSPMISGIMSFDFFFLCERLYRQFS